MYLISDVGETHAIQNKYEAHETFARLWKIERGLLKTENDSSVCTQATSEVFFAYSCLH